MVSCAVSYMSLIWLLGNYSQSWLQLRQVLLTAPIVGWFGPRHWDQQTLTWSVMPMDGVSSKLNSSQLKKNYSQATIWNNAPGRKFIAEIARQVKNSILPGLITHPLLGPIQNEHKQEWETPKKAWFCIKVHEVSGNVFNPTWAKHDPCMAQHGLEIAIKKSQQKIVCWIFFPSPMEPQRPPTCPNMAQHGLLIAVKKSSNKKCSDVKVDGSESWVAPSMSNAKCGG